MADAVTLAIGGQIFSGWTEVEVTRAIDAVAASYQLGVTERWPGHPDRWVIAAGASCVVAIGGEPVITGYVDGLDSDLSGESHSIGVSGRSKSADLVDCSALNSPGSWSGRSLEAIANEITAPFGISVTAQVPTAPPFKKFALQPGDTAWDAIERMLRQRGLVGITDAAGDIQLVAPKTGAANLTVQEGIHFKTVRGKHDVGDRFSLYVAKGQAAGDDHASGAATAGPKGEATDPAVTRYRPLVVMAEEQATPASLAIRARYEATVRAARAQAVTVTMVDWRRPDGLLWAPMQLVHVVAPSAWIDEVLLVVGVTYRLGAKARGVEVRFGRAEAFSQLAVPEDAKASTLIKQRDAAPLRGRR